MCKITLASRHLWATLLLLAPLALVANSLPPAPNSSHSRGIGIYPGNPQEYFGPTLQPSDTYRNLALHRPAYASSAYDYNLTAQLATDGIVPTQPLPRLAVSVGDSLLPRRGREWSIDGNDWSTNTLVGEQARMAWTWHGMQIDADRIVVQATVAYHPAQATQGFAVTVHTGNGRESTLAGSLADTVLPGQPTNTTMSDDPNKQSSPNRLPARQVRLDIPLSPARPFSQLALRLDMAGAAYWQVSEVQFFKGQASVTDVLPAAAFGSAWMSDGQPNPWLYVDLGSRSAFDEVRLHWLDAPRRATIDVSDDGQAWRTLATIRPHHNRVQRLRLHGQGRYVRLSACDGLPRPIALGELEVMGRGGLLPRPHPRRPAEDGRLWLDGGDWRLQRASEVGTQRGEDIAQPTFYTRGWLAATVPATVLGSYIHADAVPEPNYDDNYLQLSESFFNSDFWYRRTFPCPAPDVAGHIFLCFDGINHRADIYLNGSYVGRIDGAFQHGRFDVGHLLRPDGNALAVRIHKVAHSGAFKEKNRENTQFNGGILGADNPTFHATVGWDWITTTPGRDIGIWNDVYLTREGAVSLADPLLSSTLDMQAGDTLATMTPRVVLRNNTAQPAMGTLRGRIGDIAFEKAVTLQAGEEREEAFLPAQHPQLSRRHMRLWWPNGYGEPTLHEADFEWVGDGETGPSAHIDYRAGIREVTYRQMDTALQLYVNGCRVTPLGGNWGFPEANLRYRGREYDIAVRAHRHMNCNMIRNWVGQTGDEEFYEACDRQGIMVWQDFWLANPVDGPNPADEQLFLDNARDYLLRMRRHPSLALYCGRNEGYPTATIDSGLRRLIAQCHPDLGYISSSADDGVSGHGPYWALPARDYFERQTGKLHSERGMPAVMNGESLRRTLRPEHRWPQNDVWGQHDYTQQGAQRGASFNSLIATRLGWPADEETFARRAQWVNYEGYRAMYEAQNTNRQGLLIWMSHPCWPSMVWQTYDYYFDPTAAYFGVRKACEPQHVQWNALRQQVEVVNRLPQALNEARVEAEAFDVRTGASLWRQESGLSVAADTTVACLPFTPERHVLLRLRLTDAAGTLLSSNDYVLPQDAPLTPTSPSAAPDIAYECTLDPATPCQAVVTVSNRGSVPALLLRLNLLDGDGQQILPAWYEDNYFHLLPGEQRRIRVAWAAEDMRVGQPSIEVTDGVSPAAAVLPCLP